MVVVWNCTKNDHTSHFIKNMNKFVLIIAVSLLICFNTQSQEQDTLKAQKFLRIGFEESNADSCIYYFHQAYNYDRRKQSVSNIAIALLNNGWIAYGASGYRLGNTYFTESLKYFKILNDSVGIASVYYALGINNKYWGRYKKALEYIHLSVKIFEQLGNEEDVIASKIVEGYIQEAWGNHRKSFEICRDIYQSVKNTSNYTDIGYAALAIGNYYLTEMQYDSASVYYDISLECFVKKNNKYGLALTYRDQGRLFSISGKKQKAFDKLKQSLSILLELNNKRGISELKILLGELMFDMNNYQEALKYLKEGQDLAIKIELTEDIIKNYLTLSKIYEKLDENKASLSFYKRHAALKDSVFNREKHEQIAEMQTKYETEKKQQQIEMQVIQLDQKQLVIKQQRLVSLILGIVVILAIMLTFVILRFYNVKKRDNEKLSKQNDEIEYKNKQITDSILYAQKIQSAILPSVKILEKNYPDHFIFFKPRDIVSGDFYYMVEQNNNKLIMAVVDCTGHGVPGAFMSMLGYAFLNEINSNLPNLVANEILEKLRIKVKNALGTSQDIDSPKDGMDMALIIFDKKNSKLQYSGAYNPLIIIRDSELLEFKGTRSPIGIHIKETAFELYEIDIKKDDRIYLFSDGYVDQFGGERKQKYKLKNLKIFLQKISQHSMIKQKELLEDNLNEWMKHFPKQIDDILIIGLKV